MAKSKSTVNKAGNYTKPGMRKRMFNSSMSGTTGGKHGPWRARHAPLQAPRNQQPARGHT